MKRWLAVGFFATLCACGGSGGGSSSPVAVATTPSSTAAPAATATPAPTPTPTQQPLSATPAPTPTPQPSGAPTPTAPPSGVTPAPIAAATTLPVFGTLSATLPAVAPGYGGTLSISGTVGNSVPGNVLTMTTALSATGAGLTPIDLSAPLSQTPIFFGFTSLYDFSPNAPVAVTLNFPSGTLLAGGSWDVGFYSNQTTGLKWIALTGVGLTAPVITHSASGDTASFSGFLSSPPLRSFFTYGFALIRY